MNVESLSDKEIRSQLAKLRYAIKRLTQESQRRAKLNMAVAKGEQKEFDFPCNKS